MKMRRSWTFATALAVGMPTALAAQSFEGVIRQRTVEIGDELLMEMMYDEEAEEPEFETEEEWIAYGASLVFDAPLDELLAEGSAEVTEVTTWIKGSLARSDFSDDMMGEGFTLVDAESGEMVMVQHQGRWFVRFSQADVEAARAEMAASMGVDLEELDRQMAELEGDSEEAELTFRDLGSAEIAGFPASGREGLSVDRAVRGWCAASEPHFARAMRRLSEGMGFEEEEEYSSSSAGEAVCGDRMPLRLQVFEPYGGMMGSGSYTVEELVSVEETSVDDERFEVPEGYTERTLQELWGGG